MSDGQTPGLMTPARTGLFAVAGGLAVGSLYLSQPLIETIASAFSVPASSAGLLVTITQIGYAIGIFLIVPLGDVLNRRRLIPIVLAISGLALAGASAAPAYGVLLAAVGAAGFVSVAAQLLIPLAGELATPERRGQVLGTIAAGAMIGILLSRTVSGVVADLLGWRAIYLIVAIITLVIAVLLTFAIPRLPAREPVPYGRLLLSVFTSVRRHPAVAPSLVINAATFAVFSLFWTALTFLLTAEPFGYSTTQIGLMGIAGLAGALIARRAGWLHDKGWSVPATGAALGLLALSLAGAWLAQASIIGLIIVVVILDIAVQGNLVLGQTRLVSLSETERSRLNTAVVVANFIGGAAGSALAGTLWALGQWPAVILGALVLTLAALLVWALVRPRLADTT